ncbi:hypothetical protein PFLUV_G00237790 [Perca fluviatilis]|uniref:Ig-like domain-containing protein n=1 Tax=Perca fluviatilis TaxID=8168 RepID=A0A6A5DZ23_PERFL|nr:uncharacterized protein LOC120549596 [Perca fluviatilis]KAF1375266.1 hypothetical protein PFLUV_G00237790 [Perca fluviatilis]
MEDGRPSMVVSVVSVVVALVALLAYAIFTYVSQHDSYVEVYKGNESVVLPCQVYWLPDITKVVWSRFDLNPTTIHQHQYKDEPHVQNQHYRGRTSSSPYPLKTGDHSLTLKDPYLCDSGVYTCTVYSKGNMKTHKTVQLQVKEPPPLSIVLLLPVGLLAVLLACFLIVFCRYNTIPVSRVEVEDGVPLVMLPFQTATPLPTDFTVEWSRCAPGPMIVHEYRNGHLVRQDKFYSNRTTLEQHRVTIGDFSLILRNPCFRDSGSYICTVYKNRDIHVQKVVRLKFKESWWSWFLRREY